MYAFFVNFSFLRDKWATCRNRFPGGVGIAYPMTTSGPVGSINRGNKLRKTGVPRFPCCEETHTFTILILSASWAENECRNSSPTGALENEQKIYMSTSIFANHLNDCERKRTLYPHLLLLLRLPRRRTHQSDSVAVKGSEGCLAVGSKMSRRSRNGRRVSAMNPAAERTVEARPLLRASLSLF